jgi:hypothetical protein
VSGALSVHVLGVGVEETVVKVTLTLPLEPSATAGLSLVSEAVKESVVGFELFELTVKLTFPFESVVAVALSDPALPPLIISPESPLVESVTVSPETGLLELSLTVTEMVAVVDPSAGIDPELRVRVELLVSALLFANAGKAKRLKENNKTQAETAILLPRFDIKVLLKQSVVLFSEDLLK